MRSEASPGGGGPNLGSWRVVAVCGVIAIGFLFLAACGGGDGESGDSQTPSATQETGATDEPSATDEGADGGAAGEIDVCSLVTREEVEAAAGNPVEEGVPALLSCWWASGLDDISVTVDLTGVPNVTQCTQTRGVGTEDVDGLGVEAWWGFTDAANAGGVVACPEGWRVQVLMEGSATTEEATLRAAGEQLMSKVLERM